MEDIWIVCASVAMEYIMLMVPVRNYVMELYGISSKPKKAHDWWNTFTLKAHQDMVHPWIVCLYRFYLYTPIFLLGMYLVSASLHISEKGFEKAFILHFGTIFSIGVLCSIAGMYLDEKKHPQKNTFLHKVSCFFLYVIFPFGYLLALGIGIQRYFH